MKKSIIIGSLFLLFSCERGHVQQYNSNPPEISIEHTNGEGTSYKSRDTVYLKALFKDSIELHDISIEVADLTNSSTVIAIGEHRHLRSLAIDTFFIIPDHEQATKYRVYLKANNHADKVSFKEVLIESHP